jgi:hypothetical protein
MLIQIASCRRDGGGVLAAVAIALHFQLMGLEKKTIRLAHLFDDVFKGIFILNRHHSAAFKTGHMVMVIKKNITQLNLIFPANVNTLRDAKFFIEFNSSIDAYSVDRALGGVDELVHCLWFGVDKQIKNKGTRFGGTILIISQYFFK